REDDAGGEEAFSRAAAVDPGTDDSLLARAAFLESRRRWAEAREVELKLLSRRPDSPDVLAALTRLSLAEGEPEVALAHAHKLLALAASSGPDAPDEERRELAGALFRAAVPLLGAHRTLDALAALDASLRIFPRHPELAFYRGLALSQRGRPREAAQASGQSERAGRGVEAVPLLESAAQKHSGGPALLFALGTALDRAGRVDGALSTMRKVLAAAPAHAGALNYVGYAMVEQGGDLGEAEGLLR